MSRILSLVLALKQQFNYLTYKWQDSNKLTLKNYYYNDINNLKDFVSNSLKIDKKHNHYKGINIYYIVYITI